MPGFDNGVMYADNVDFTGGDPVSATMTTDGQLLIGNTGTGRPTVSTLTAGDNISITNGAGSITINALPTSLVINVTSLTDADSAYVVLSTDYYLSCNVNAGILEIDLPNAGNTGRVIVVKDSGGDANTNNITVTTVGGTVRS
jgi:hypothetical protein